LASFQKGAHVLRLRQSLTVQFRFAAGKIEKQGCEFDRVGAWLFTVGSPVGIDALAVRRRLGSSRV